MKLLSIDGFCFALAVILGLVPVLTSIQEKRPPNLAEWISIVTATVLAVATFYSAIENSKRLHRVENRITSFSIEISVDFSWPTGSDPLLDNGNDGGTGEAELLWLSSPNGLLRFYSPLGYSVTRTSATSARFTATLAPKNGGAPLGQQRASLKQVTNYSVFVPLKNYWTNGRDNYHITVDRHRLVFRINNQNVVHEEETMPNVTPEKTDGAIWGLLDIHGKIEQGLADLFENEESKHDSN